MMKYTLILILVLSSFDAWSQNFTQNIKGTVSDKNLISPIEGVKLYLNGDSSNFVLSDSNGNYEFKNVLVGRIKIVASHKFYSEQSIPNLLLTSGKELVVNFHLEEQIKEKSAFVVRGKASKIKPLNEMATVSTRTFSVEETQKFAAAVNDPARMATSFAGVIGADDGNNTIVIRGNSPIGMLWRMEGIDIPGPNHFSSFNGSGGGISILSAQLLGNSDFMSSAFAAEYGNALSGVFDLRLRKGNSKKREYTLQAGFLGLDLATEGPLSKKGGSYLVNYRYSTLGIIKQLGIKIGESSTLFQDLAYNIALPKSRIGNITFFGFAGISKQLQSAKKDSALWKFQSDRYDIFYGSNTIASGMTHLLNINKRNTLRTVVLYSSNTITDKGEYLEKDYTHFYTHWKNNIGNSKLAWSSTINHKISNKLHLRSGFIANYWAFKTEQRDLDSNGRLRTFLDSKDQTFYAQAFSQVKWRFNSKLNVFAGAHGIFLGLNKTSSLEPRLSARYELNSKQTATFGYGLHSQLQLPGVYFTQLQNENAEKYYPNKNLGLSKAHHFVAGYEMVFKSQTRIKLEAYYQHLFNIPIGLAANSTFSTLNLNFGLVNEALVNKGKGRNYGIELTAERFLNKGLYYILSASLYQSEYQTITGQSYNTRFNGKHALTFTGGKEFKINGGKKLFGINIKTTWYGGFRQTPVDANMSRLYQTTMYDETKPFSIQLANYFRTDLKFSYRINHAKYNSIWSLDIQNASNRENIGGTYYDINNNAVKTWYQTPLIPVFSYKLEF